MKLLVIVPHPDDEFHCAGTAIKHVRAGDSVTIVWMTRGDLGHMTLPREEVMRLRTKEGEAAARVIGADTRFLDYGDSAVPYDRQTTLVVVDLIREFKPSVVITWGPGDAHPDHRNTHRNVVDAMHLTALPLLETSFPPHDPDALYFFSLGLGEDCGAFVDVSDVIEEKMLVARCHKSQYEEWLIQHQAGTDKNYPKDAEGMYHWAREKYRGMGIRCGVKYAEGFIPFKHPKPKALELLPSE